MPGYVSDFEKLKSAGAEVVVCTSTDNGFVLAEWGKQHKAEGKVCNSNAQAFSMSQDFSKTVRLPYLQVAARHKP